VAVASPTVAVPIAAPVQVPVPTVLPVAAPVAAPVSGNFQYSAELDSLLAMGFPDVDLNKYLLVNNRGDVANVINWILANAPQK